MPIRGPPVRTSPRLRVQPAAAHYRGQLYVMGGFETTLTSSGGGPPTASWAVTNTTEAMASNGSWSNHTDLGVALAGAGATVIHDEVVLMGGASSTGAQRARMAGFETPMHGATWATSFTRCTAWPGRTTTTPPTCSVAIQGTPRGVGCNCVPPTTATSVQRNMGGTITSPPIDVRTAADGDALLRWVRLDGSAPAGTSLGLPVQNGPGCTAAERDGLVAHDRELQLQPPHRKPHGPGAEHRRERTFRPGIPRSGPMVPMPRRDEHDRRRGVDPTGHGRRVVGHGGNGVHQR